MSVTTVGVFVEVDGSTLEVGTARFGRRRNRLSTTVVYHPAYLADPRAYPLDPRLELTTGTHYVDGLPGSFRDCSPDRWGRNLIARRHRAIRIQGTAPSVSEVDFLVGVSDETRQGALRFTDTTGGEFVHSDPSVPPLITLPRLLRAADAVARDDSDLTAIRELLDAGSGSLGGARPKASVRADDGRLLMAKFPHAADDWDVIAWEKTALDLAVRAGIDTPPRRLVSIGGRQVLLIDRFDRSGGRRAGYISAMTMVGGSDGAAADYADIADYLAEQGARVDDDLAALFRRAVFSVAIHNTDDHLRNHGFLRGSGGWSLAPVFDVNPDPEPGTARATSIAGAVDPSDEPDGLLLLAGACRVAVDRVATVVSEVLAAVADWQDVAAGNGVTKADRTRFEGSFEQGRHGLDKLVDRRAPSSTDPRRRTPARRPSGPGGGRFRRS